MENTDEICAPEIAEQYENNDDIEFCSFYDKALNQLLDIHDKANVSYLYRYFKIFNEYYNQWCAVESYLQDHNDDIIKLLEDSLYFRFAFTYRNATLLSSAVAFHFRNTCERSSANIERLVRKKIVKICSLGGCSASDIVAIVTVLESIALKKGIEFDFRVTIIESDKQWMITCITILRCLKTFKEDTWKITFIPSNLSQKNAWTQKIRKAIEEADIISMVKFISKQNMEEKVINDICKELQYQALLFVLDHPTKDVVDHSFEVTYSDDFELIYKEVWDFHPLDIAAVKLFRNSIQVYFGSQKQFRPNTSLNVFAGAWIKATPKLDRNCKKTLECIFQNNVEKYNPKQSFLSANAFARWEHSFTKEKEAAGWNYKGTKKIVEKEKGKRNCLLVELINEKKKLDAFQKNMLSEFQTYEEVKERIEDNFKMYLKRKSNYSNKKNIVYYSSF